MIFPPAAARLFARWNLSESRSVMTTTKHEARIVAYIPGRYSGLSCSRKTVVPTIPPIPPAPTRVAEASARFH